MSVYAVGDVQGCYDPLRKLLDQARFDAQHDRLWLVGDLVNRGPASLEVLRFVKSLGGAAVVVLGNHDLHFLAVASGARAKRREDTLDAVLQAADRDELVTWLKGCPLVHHDAALGFVMTHAGIPPQWSIEEALAYGREVQQALPSSDSREFFEHMYGDDPLIWSDDLEGWPRLRAITNYLTRMRFCGANGELDLRAKQSADAPPNGMLAWFRHPRRKTANDRVIFGHWATLAGKADTPNVFALDTGCVYGGALTLLDLETQRRLSCDCRR